MTCPCFSLPRPWRLLLLQQRQRGNYDQTFTRIAPLLLFLVSELRKYAHRMFMIHCDNDRLPEVLENTRA